jgi:hypothetical protein
MIMGEHRVTIMADVPTDVEVEPASPDEQCTECCDPARFRIVIHRPGLPVPLAMLLCRAHADDGRRRW